MMPFDIEKAREACNRATFHLVGDQIDEDLKVLVDQAALLPAALDALEASQKQCRDLTAEIAELRRTVDVQAGVIQAQAGRVDALEAALIKERACGIFWANECNVEGSPGVCLDDDEGKEILVKARAQLQQEGILP